VDGLTTYKDLIHGWVTVKREELDECRFGEAFELSGLGEPEVAIVRPGDPALHLGRI
jgi:hypothetical protein